MYDYFCKKKNQMKFGLCNKYALSLRLFITRSYELAGRA